MEKMFLMINKVKACKEANKRKSAIIYRYAGETSLHYDTKDLLKAFEAEEAGAIEPLLLLELKEENWRTTKVSNSAIDMIEKERKYQK